MNRHGALNRVFRVVWNASKSVWQAVCETGKSHGKAASTVRLARRAAGISGIVIAGASLAAPAANELPSGGTVVGGSAVITSSGSNMLINQTSSKVAIDWNTFNIGSASHVHFEQPSGGAALNRVLSSNASEIYGRLTSTGQVFLVNPNGVFFAPGAQVNVGGIVASTLSIDPAAFMNGSLTFSGQSSNAIINQGNITAAPGGTIALIAAKITNDGTLTAEKGNVLLGAGSKVTLDMGGPVKLQIENSALETLIQNGGAIKADGGTIWLTSQAANKLASSVINNTGVIEAQTLATGETGEVILFAHDGHMQVGGTIKAEGGFVETSGKTFAVTPGAEVKAGHWLIDPNEITIDAAMATTLGGQLSSSGSASVQTSAHSDSDPGNIVVAAPMSWSSGTLTLQAHNDINVNAVMSITGNGGIVLNSGWDGISAYGTRGGLNMAMNATKDAFIGKIDFASTGSVSINGNAYTIVRNRAGLEAMASGLSGRYVLGADLTNGNDLSGAAWTTTIGDTGTSFTGAFDGLGHVASGLNMSTTTMFSGLFGAIGGNASVSNIGLTGVNITTTQQIVGALVGYALGGTSVKINNVFSTGAIQGNVDRIGGLVGYFANGVMNNAHSSVAINGSITPTNSNTNVGGLVGKSDLATISNSSASGAVKGYYYTGGLLGGSTQGVDIKNSSATGNVSGNTFGVGGLAGMIAATSARVIENSFATGSVAASAGQAGGLVGDLGAKYTIKTSYATGAVSGATYVGGLVGDNSSADTVAIQNSFSTGAVTGTSGTAAVGGLVGRLLGRVTNSYSTGLITGSGADVKGLVGTLWYGTGTVTNSYYDSTVNSGASLSGTGNVGKTTADLKKSTTFSGWDIVEDSSLNSVYPQLRWNTTGLSAGTSVWVIGPLGTPVTYTFGALSGTYTYSGNPYSLTNLWSASSLFGGTYSGWVLGTDYTFKQSGTTVTSFTNAGTYNNITVDILKSGFIAASSGNTAGSLTIAKAPLSVSANNVTTTYNGSAYAGTPGVTYSGFVTPTGGSQETSAVLGGSLAYAYSTINPTHASTYTITPSGLTSSNYDITFNTGTLTIDKKALTVTGLAAQGKTYDGTRTAIITGTPGLSGVLGGDAGNVSLSGTASGLFADANVGTGKAVSLTGLSLGGSAAGDYTLTVPESLTADITGNSNLDTAVSVAQTSATVTPTNPLSSLNPSTPSLQQPQLASTPQPVVMANQAPLPIIGVSGGLALVQLPAAPVGTGAPVPTVFPAEMLGRDPFGFARLFVIAGGVSLPHIAVASPLQGNADIGKQQ